MSIIYIDLRPILDTTKSHIKDSYLVLINQNNIKKIKDGKIEISTIFRHSTSEDFFSKISTATQVIILIKTEISQNVIDFIQEYLTQDIPYIIHVYTDYIKNIPEENIIKLIKLNIQNPPKRQLLNNHNSLSSPPFIDFYSKEPYESYESYESNEPNEIIPGLFLSGVNCVNDDILEKYNIKTVLSIMSNPPELDESKYKHMKIKILDSPRVNISDHFEATHEFINNSLKEKKNILVHCHAGISRSATIVISYIMNIQLITADIAFRFVKNKREIINPNIGFCYNLRQYEDIIVAKKKLE
jgi:predicted protein tyrosine phosphatase